MARTGETLETVISSDGSFVGGPTTEMTLDRLNRLGQRSFREESTGLVLGRVQVWALILLALSALDFLMTAWLLRTSSRFYEANPVAQWFLARWDLVGLLGFKFAIIFGVIGLGEYIERRRTGLGRLILAIGSVAATYAIIQGASLLSHPAMTGEDDLEPSTGPVQTYTAPIQPLRPSPAFIGAEQVFLPGSH